MPEPELHVRSIAHYGPVCESGRHFMHPMETCEEWEAYAAAARALYERAMAAAFAEADRLLITGNGTGEMQGFRVREPEHEPTPAERALAILEPHLSAIALYQAGPNDVTPAQQSSRNT